MPRPKRDEILRYETPEEEVYVNFHDTEEEAPEPAPAPIRDSGVVLARKPIVVKRGKGKRSVEDMMASMPNDLAQSSYALERVAAIEDQIVKVLELCSPAARELVLKQRPSLRRYTTEE